ncbi:hypothetical protein ABW19_dt0206021 [Dactylella cylindrospora]|nr:hypothetical protein ABW19_dt0206021 [Dactylella cylindrospora]
MPTSLSTVASPRAQPRKVLSEEPVNKHPIAEKRSATSVSATRQQQIGSEGEVKSAAKLRREATAAYFRKHARDPDLTKISRNALKDSKVYNRLPGCDISLLHPARNLRSDIPSEIDDNINLRVSIAQDNLKIVAILRQKDPKTDKDRFYNLASLNWPITSLPNSRVRFFVDKLNRRMRTRKNKWQYVPTYFFEVRNQGKIERSYLDLRVHEGITNNQLQAGYKTIVKLRDMILQAIHVQKTHNPGSSPAIWFAVHSLSPQTDEDDALKQICGKGSKFQHVTWDAVPEVLLGGALRVTMKNLQRDITGSGGGDIGVEVWVLVSIPLCIVPVSLINASNNRLSKFTRRYSELPKPWERTESPFSRTAKACWICSTGPPNHWKLAWLDR